MYSSCPSSTNSMSDTLNSPQGDGNSQSYLSPLQHSPEWSDTLNSPQGDGNFEGFYLGRNNLYCQTPSIPRKGTETILDKA